MLKKATVIMVLSIMLCLLYNNITISEPAIKMDNIDLNPHIYSDYYIDRVTTFMHSDAAQGKIVFLGDSITDICEWSEILNNTNILNRGISGDTTEGAFNRLSEVLRLKPRKIFIMLGINDIGKCRAVSSIIEDYGKILGSIKAALPDTEVYVQSVLPINKDIFKTHTEEEEIVEFNAALKELCKNNSVRYIDLYSSFTKEKNKLNPDYTTGGLHLNGNGYNAWKDIIKEYCR